MRLFLLFVALNFLALPSQSQSHGFPFGRVTYKDMEITSYSKDTSAVALVLKEFGEAYFEDDDGFKITFKHHVKIKILKKGGLAYADFEIPLRKIDGRTETIRSIRASTFNVENGSIKEVAFNLKNQFTDNKNKYWDIKKFALPNVRVGSVIEVEYEMESPFIMKFRTWEFQSDIPKVSSEFWASIPGNYKYNISLKGYLALAKNESEISKGCFDYGTAKADCLLLRLSMDDIPAFTEEDYMTAKSNFLSAVNFELSEIQYFDGRRDKITKDWKDVELEIRQDSKFGVQLRRGGDIVDEKIEQLIKGVSDPLVKAQKIYDFIKGWYRWNEKYGEYSEFGIKKAFDNKVGNVGDINLSLIAALNYAGYSVEPLLLSTRENGLVSELHPVLTDFNYVIAKLNIGEKIYLLDATEDYLCFGLIPERCLNGKGRVLGEKESYWYDLKAPEKQKQISVQKLKIDGDGTIRGSVQNMFFGYDAMHQRRIINSFSDEKAFVESLTKRWDAGTVTTYKIENASDVLKPLTITLEVEIGNDLGSAPTQLLNLFMFDRWEKNPFRSSDRMYPVDFGVPMEEVVSLTLEYPAGYELDELPGKVGLTLPSGGGRYLFTIQNTSNTLSMYSSLTINKPVFSSEEYHYLKELFSHVVATQQTDLVLKKKL
ncbi:MAG TPA: DUF3857 domain-containing protein [Chryseolinea sp.]|nr:DUF3857 domain-containing protein [Chryseolinea sp.]